MKDKLVHLYVIVFLFFAFLVGSLVGSCASTDPTINKVLNKTKTKEVKILECGKLEIKVCNGPDKKQYLNMKICIVNAITDEVLKKQ